MAYAVLTYKYNQDLFKGEPEVKFELHGSHLFDPRSGSTVMTFNPIVMIYNILRGIELPDGSVYGGECEEADLPIDNWAAAMNVCDEDEGGEPRYRAGFEIKIAEDQPADVIEELLKAASAEITEIGGTYKVRVGPPALPVMFITDEDFLVTKEQGYEPFPGINSGKNTIFASYPHPEEGWSSHEAPMLTDDDYLAQDGGIELTGELQLPTVPFPLQVQRLMRGWLQDDRRWRTHTGTLGQYGFILEPLDTIAWTSQRNGYIEKLFEVDSTDEQLTTLENAISLREVDPSDYDWTPGMELPDPVTPGEWQLPEPQAVPGFGVEPYIIRDDESEERRAAIRAFWSPDGAEDAALLKIEVRNAVTQDAVTSITVTNPADGSVIISEGILPLTSYEVRAQYIVDRPTEWTAWLGVITGNILLGSSDIDGYQDLLDDMAAADIKIAELLGVAEDLLNSVDDLYNSIVEAGGEIDLLQTTVATQGASIESNTLAISNAVGNIASIEDTLEVQGATINNHTFALNTLDTTVGSIQTTITTQGATITSHTTAITNLTTSVGNISTTVSSQGATISSQATAISHLEDDLAITIDTVEVQGVTVTNTAAALSYVEDDVTTLFGRAGVTVDVNGRLTGWEINNNGSYGAFTIHADYFSITKPGSGARTEYSGGNWRVYDSSGNLAVRMGVW